MSGIIYQNKKYINLYHDFSFKWGSLEDHVYFTLRDFYLNCASVDHVIDVNNYLSTLSNNICYEDRTATFKYAPVLDDEIFLVSLSEWLNDFRACNFVFIALKDQTYKKVLQDDGVYINFICHDDSLEQYMLYDAWWFQVKTLIALLQVQLKYLNFKKI